MSIREIKQYAADRLHGMGYNLIPLEPRGKKPFFSEWKLRQVERMSRVELRSVFLRHDCNLGIIMGELEETGVNVLGVDTDSDAGISYVRKHFPPSNTIVRTAKGLHHYFQLPRGLRPVNSTKWNGQDIDIRAHGSYLVAPPSEHETGFVYQFIKGPRTATEQSFFAPDLLKVERPVPVQVLGEPETWQVEGMRKWIRQVHAIRGTGTGDKDCYRVAIKICSVVQDFTQALAEIMAWNSEGFARPPFTEKELVHKIQCALKYVMK